MSNPRFIPATGTLSALLVAAAGAFAAPPRAGPPPAPAVTPKPPSSTQAPKSSMPPVATSTIASGAKPKAITEPVKVHGNSNLSNKSQTQYGIFKVDTWKEKPIELHKTGVSGAPNKSAANLSTERAALVSGAGYSPRALSQLSALNSSPKWNPDGRYAYVTRNLRTIEADKLPLGSDPTRVLIKKGEQNTVTLAAAKNGGAPPPGNALPNPNKASYWNPNPGRIVPAK